jgi:hypothetical protein
VGALVTVGVDPAGEGGKGGLAFYGQLILTRTWRWSELEDAG